MHEHMTYLLLTMLSGVHSCSVITTLNVALFSIRTPVQMPPTILQLKMLVGYVIVNSQYPAKGISLHLRNSDSGILELRNSIRKRPKRFTTRKTVSIHVHVQLPEKKYIAAGTYTRGLLLWDWLYMF